MEKGLKLSEKLYLLSMRPEKGGIWNCISNNLNHVLIGAFILEMYQASAIKIQNKRIQVLVPGQADEIHSLLLGKAKGFKDNRRISYWIRNFHFSISSSKKLLLRSMAHQKLIYPGRKKIFVF